MTAAKPSSLQRRMLFVYGVLSIALAALLLPSILRPPQDQQSTTAQFSGDAPPENQPDAIIQSTRQARSATAGTPEEIIIEEEPVTRKKLAVRSGCFGDPPRQTESLYSHLCVPAYTGNDNGGETYRGVTATEIRVGVAVPADSTVTEGPLSREFSDGDTADTRVIKVWQTYFNARFEFYKRYMQFYVFKVSSSSSDQAQAAAAQAGSRHGGMFAFAHQNELSTAAVTTELARQKVVNFTHEPNPASFYKDNHPFVYSFEMDSWNARYMGAELVCNQFANKALTQNNLNGRRDATMNYDEPRRFGLIVYQDELRVGAVDMYSKGLAKCGAEFVATQEMTLGTDGDTSGVAQAVAKMRQNGVTTIVLSGDPISPGLLTQQATRIGYFPEWVCVVNCESNTVGRLLDDAQAAAFLTVGFGEIPRADFDKDWYRAFKEIDPEGAPEFVYFRELQQLSGAIQHAGTKLTPESVWQGLKRQPCRDPIPNWSIGGCYGEAEPSSDTRYLGDFTYSDYASLLWFDPDGDDPESSTAGAWCWMNDGQRYRLGTMPKDPLPVGDRKQCIHTPSRGQLG